jgi:quercetin dioxygenase-like cupin family protein
MFTSYLGQQVMERKLMLEKSARLRPPPDARFAGDSHCIDLKEVLGQLRAEAPVAKRKLRQMTLFHNGPITQALFVFEPDGELVDHSAHGWVTIQAVEGHLTVTAAGVTHELETGMLVVLNPGVRHNVRATAKTGGAMLLTVFLDKSAS